MSVSELLAFADTLIAECELKRAAYEAYVEELMATWEIVKEIAIARSIDVNAQEVRRVH